MPNTIEILLTDDVLALGDMGDIVKVKSGYARNFLLPQGLAVQADRAAKRQIEILQERAKGRELERQGQALAAKKRLDGVSVQVAARVAHEDVLFGSVGARDIVKALAPKGFALDPRQVLIHETFKKLGRVEVQIRLHKGVEATVAVEIVSADPKGGGLDEQLASTGAGSAKETGAKSAGSAKEASSAKPAGSAKADKEKGKKS